MSSLWKSFTTLSPKTRILIGGGLIAYGLAGSYLTDRAEEVFNMVPTDDDKRRLKEMMPRVVVVDKGGGGDNATVEGVGGGDAGVDRDKGMEAELERLRREKGR